MNNVFDTKERIARSNIYSIFGKFIRRQIDNNDYSLIPSREEVQQRNTDISYLHSMLEMHHPDLVILYDEAITNFGSGQYVSCDNMSAV